MPASLPDKLFFRIGEVAALVGVKPHVLRYWEQELGVPTPMKTRGAHRQYRRRDVELALRIREMLEGEGLTLAGVRRRLREPIARTSGGREGGTREPSGRDAHAAREPAGAPRVAERNARSERAEGPTLRDAPRREAELRLRAALLELRAELVSLAKRFEAEAEPALAGAWWGAGHGGADGASDDRGRMTDDAAARVEVVARAPRLERRD